MSDDTWKLIIYRDLKPLFIAHESLLRLSSKFDQLSSKYPNFPTVVSTKSYLKVNLDKINSRLSELNMYLGKNTRQKRELLDGLSSLLKYLIGTPDAKDAKHYNECIDMLEKRELDLTSLMQKQVQITSSTIKNFNETIFKISYDEQIINENIDRLNEYLNSTTNTIFDIRVSEDISSISIQILESVTSLENEINDCLTSILFAKSNIIHPSIISLNKLHQELLLSNHARSNKQLVSPVTINNINNILDSSQLSAYVFSNRLVYILDFPLVKSETLKLYHIYSIPIQHPNSSLHTTILPEHKYLATSPSGEHYISTSSLDNCKIYAEKRRVCSDLVVYDADTRPICELQVLFSAFNKIPSTCTTSTFAAIINTFQPLADNRWIYILTNVTQCILQCDNQVSHHNIQGSGIIILQENCKLHTGYSTLSAHQTKQENITYPIIVPDIQTDDCFEDIKSLSIPNLLPISINEIPLDSLNTLKHQLDNHNNEIQKVKNTPFIQRNQNGFSWFSFISGTLMLLLVLYALFKKCLRFQMNRRTFEDNNHCVQIFNNCFGSSSRRRTSHIQGIPMTTVGVSTTTSCISEDEEDDPNKFQRSGTGAQSLF